MKRSDLIKLRFIRNWQFPGKERFSSWIKSSDHLKSSLKDGIVWLNNEDIAIITTADNYIEWCILSGGTYEEEIGKLIKISLKPGYFALDIGANIGLQTLRMSQCVGNTGHVYAFEPLDYLRDKFKRNMRLNNVKNISLLPFALSDISSEVDFRIDKNLWNQGTFNLSDQNGTEKQKVHIKIADDLDELKSLTRLDLIKIDVEGFEYSVLKGLFNILHRFKPRIIFEFDNNYWLRSSNSLVECYNLLESLNYTLYQVTAIGCEVIKSVNDIQNGNIFCIQKISEK